MLNVSETLACLTSKNVRLLSIISSFFLLSACGDALTSLTRQQAVSGGVGYTAGIATAATAQKVKEAFTPVFDILVYPQKICERTTNGMQCIVVPCAFATESHEEIVKKCVSLESEDAFWAREGKVESLDTSSFNLSVLKNLCERNPKSCQEFLGKLEGSTVLFVKKEK